MTETIDTAQPEALRLANSLFTAAAGSDAGIYTGTMRAAAQELRRLHAANVYTSDLCAQALDEVRRLTSELAAAEARNATLTDDAARELIEIARDIEALKRECGMDPESPTAIQNGRYMALSYKVRALAAMKEKTP